MQGQPANDVAPPPMEDQYWDAVDRFRREAPKLDPQTRTKLKPLVLDLVRRALGLS